MESSSIFGAEKMEPNDFENNERALVALRDDDAAAFCTFTNRDEMPREYGCGPFTALLTSFFQNAVTKNVVVGKEQLQINAATWPWSAEESTRAPAQNFIDADARNTRKMAKKSKKCLTVGV